MSLLKNLKKKRRQAKLDAKAAKTRAKAEVKARASLTKSQQKLLAKQEKQLRKAEAKGLKAKRKHEMRLAETKLKQLKAGRVNKDNVARLLGVARFAAPVLLPLAYQAITALQKVGTQAQAQRLGVEPAKLGQFSGYGAPLKARISGLQETLKDSTLASGFKRDALDRLDSLSEAVDNAEFLTPEQRRRAHRSIRQDIDAVAGQIDDRHQGRS